MTAEREPSASSLLAGLLKALGAMLGLHVQYAQREAKEDLGRVLMGVVLLVLGALLLLVALLLAHAGLVFYLARAVPRLSFMRATWIVAGADVLVALPILLVGRARLRKPILTQTRTLVRRTVTSIAEL